MDRRTGFFIILILLLAFALRFYVAQGSWQYQLGQTLPFEQAFRFFELSSSAPAQLSHIQESAAYLSFPSISPVVQLICQFFGINFSLFLAIMAAAVSLSSVFLMYQIFVAAGATVREGLLALSLFACSPLILMEFQNDLNIFRVTGTCLCILGVRLAQISLRSASRHLWMILAALSLLPVTVIDPALLVPGLYGIIALAISYRSDKSTIKARVELVTTTLATTLVALCFLASIGRSFNPQLNQNLSFGFSANFARISSFSWFPYFGETHTTLLCFLGLVTLWAHRSFSQLIWWFFLCLIGGVQSELTIMFAAIFASAGLLQVIAPLVLKLLSFAKLFAETGVVERFLSCLFFAAVLGQSIGVLRNEEVDKRVQVIQDVKEVSQQIESLQLSSALLIVVSDSEFFRTRLATYFQIINHLELLNPADFEQVDSENVNRSTPQVYPAANWYVNRLPERSSLLHPIVVFVSKDSMIGILREHLKQHYIVLKETTATMTILANGSKNR